MLGIPYPQLNSGWDLNKQCHVRVQKKGCHKHWVPLQEDSVYDINQGSIPIPEFRK